MAGWLSRLMRASRNDELRASRSEDGRADAMRSRKSVPSHLIAYQSSGNARWAPRNYAGFAREGMMQNAVVYRCVRLVAEAAASVPLLVYVGADDVEDHALVRLLERPAPGVTGTDLLEDWYGYLLVSGNAFLQAVGTEGDISGLQVLRPDRVRVVTDSDGWPIAHEYVTSEGASRIPGEIVPGVARLLHQKLFHPDNDHYGLSPIEAAASAIDIHNGASRWNKALLDNAARPSGALVYSAGEQMTSEQFDRLKSELEENFQGARNAGRPLLLEGGLDWKAMSLTPRDMDFIAAKNAAAREIALALGVPPMLLGIPGDNTYANYQEANRTFWRQTVLPLVQRTARAMSGWLGPAFDGARIRPDLDQIEALGLEREALWRRLEAVSFLTVDEKRAAVGYGPHESAAKDDG